MAVLNLNVSDTQFESNVQMKSKSFGIGDVSAIIDILRNRMYSHPIRTLVQEYICNARDAMIEAGTLNKHKLSITSPTKLACEFRVRDFGVGLSEERVQNVFTMYGASTKRNTNGQIGGYGLGAKSAWAYTDSFTVVSFFNGTKTTYLCHVGRDNIGSMDILNQEVTQEPNGVEIVVTVKPADIDAFQQAVKRCVTFWDRDTIKTNIEIATVQQLYGRKDFEEGNIIVFNSNSNQYTNQDTFVVDGIQFVSPTSVNGYSGLHIFLKTGEVDIAPSRESIIDNDKFKQVLASIKAQIKSYQSKIDSTVDIATKIELALKYKPLLGMRDIKVDDNFSIVNNGSHFRVNSMDLARRYSNKNGGVVYDKPSDSVSSRYFSFPLSKDTYVIIADDSVSQVRRRLEYYFSTVQNTPTSKLKYNLTSYVVCLKDKSQMQNFLLDKLTVIEAGNLPIPAKITTTSNTKPQDSVRVLQYSTYSGVLSSRVIHANDMRTTDAIKVPFNKFLTNQKLTSIAKVNTDLKIYALSKDDFKNSKLPTLEEYIETKAVEERKKIGFVRPSVWQKIATTFPKLITHSKWGELPLVVYLNDAEIEEHRKQQKELGNQIDNVLKKFPLAVLINNGSEEYLSEVITYIKLKEAV